MISHKKHWNVEYDLGIVWDFTFYISGGSLVEVGKHYAFMN